MPLNPRLTVPELRAQIELVAPRLLLPDADRVGIAETLAPEAKLAWRLIDSVTLDAPTMAPPATQSRAAIPADQVHTILFTSGTTGRAKGVMLTHASLAASAAASRANLGTGPTDRWLLCMPLFHVGGLSILLRSAIDGFAVTLHESFDEHAANAAIDGEGISIVSVVAVMLQRMLVVRGGAPYPATFRCALLGGGPASQPLLRDCADRGLPVVQTYGLTEAGSQVTTLGPSEALAHLGSAGRVLVGTRVRVVRDGADTVPGDHGEIWVQGATVMAGYYSDSDATARALTDGWLHTGDIGVLDADGYLSVLDRRDDLIVSGGENVYPAEVEAVLLAHPAVAEAAVVGLPDARWGRRPAAAVVLHPGMTVVPDNLRDFCAERLAAYKRPIDIRIVATLPRTAAGKLQRHLVGEGWQE